jgi:ABC-type glycerol-3-phosphate transport system permease component
MPARSALAGISRGNAFKINKPYRLVVGAVCALILVFFLGPIVWMVLTSLKKPVDAFAIPPVWLFAPTMKAYIDLFSMYPYLAYLRNSLIVSLGSVALCVAFGVPTAYYLARMRARRADDVAFWFLSQRMLPAIAIVLPIYIMMNRLSLFDTQISLVLTYSSFNLPFLVWMMRDYFRSMPVELDEAAMIDGCSRLGALLRVNLPVAFPGLAATAILILVASWNEFLFALVLTSTQARTVPLVVTLFMNDQGIMWPQMMAAGTITALPVLLFAILFQRRIISGLTLGAVKA